MSLYKFVNCIQCSHSFPGYASLCPECGCKSPKSGKRNWIVPLVAILITSEIATASVLIMEARSVTPASEAGCVPRVAMMEAADTQSNSGKLIGLSPKYSAVDSGLNLSR